MRFQIGRDFFGTLVRPIRGLTVFGYFFISVYTSCQIWVVLFYPDISNFTFQNVKFLKCKIFNIDFLDELGNLKQKEFTLQNVKFFYILEQHTPWSFLTHDQT